MRNAIWIADWYTAEVVRVATAEDITSADANGRLTYAGINSYRGGFLVRIVSPDRYIDVTRDEAQHPNH